ncbi:membrane protein [Caballeronia terrestris]|jgi:hypothetical protein|uniref:Membrane protein n=1 Tax=Caballeronia terrestris TaxID=1226301 RepID=A0A158FRS7_9BURK|nr:DUF4148 domain-containing protein [Caballeronia terrestris]SAL22079.1 membrane protein [Caballeronia terrestris]
MKTFLSAAAAVVSLLAAPAFAATPSNAPLTRAQVKAELTQLEQAGYSVGGEDAHYPEQLQAAEARIAAAPNAGQSAYGAAAPGSSASGVRADADKTGTRATFFGQ